MTTQIHVYVFYDARAMFLCAIKPEKVNCKCVSSIREMSNCAFKKPILELLSVKKKN